MDRKQYVSISGECSNILPVVSGVPQGSILGPLLFIIYINDLSLCSVHSSTLLFADDTKCFKQISSHQDSCHLQDDINAISTWAKQWCLSFNVPKIVHLRFSKYSASQSLKYFINRQEICTSQSHRDLGVTVSSNLSWTSHYNNICSKAYRTLGLLQRSISCTSIKARKLLYVVLVRSQLTYCSCIWRPNLIKDIIMLEKVQRRATKFILSDYKSDYKTRLCSLNLLPLMMYYEILDITFFLKSMGSKSTSFNVLSHVAFVNGPTRSAMTYSQLFQN